jgi:hypothetical protein
MTALVSALRRLGPTYIAPRACRFAAERRSAAAGAKRRAALIVLILSHLITGVGFVPEESLGYELTRGGDMLAWWYHCGEL